MASSQQHERKPSTQRRDSALFLNDFVSLPIIITDFDAERTGSDSKKTQTRSEQNKSETSSVTSSSTEQNWSTGFSDFADEVWRSMTSTMRTKLREAAVEVLKRTDDQGKPQEELWTDWDDDARFLD